MKTRLLIIIGIVISVGIFLGLEVTGQINFIEYQP